MVRVAFDAVSYSYGRKRVIEGFSWELRDGVTGLIGPNGAGKTTLINLLVGIAKPDSGGIRVPTFGAQSQGGKARFGFVPQRFSVAAEMRVIDTIAYAAWVNGVERRECQRRATEVLETVDLLDQARSRVRSLSGGQRQRLGIAAGISHRPDLLVLDEPTVGLDPGQRVRAREVIQAIGLQIPVLLSTHLIEDVSHLCQRVGVIADGRLVFDGTMTELEELVGQTQQSGGLGSNFEVAYTKLIASMGSQG